MFRLENDQISRVNDFDRKDIRNAQELEIKETANYSGGLGILEIINCAMMTKVPQVYKNRLKLGY